MSELLTGWFLALLLGVRHAIEPDHVAAVSTLVSQERSGWRSAWLGASWGLGHASALFSVGALLVIFHRQLSDRFADLFELGVAAMLLGLGVRALILAYRLGTRGPSRPHAHGALEHEHGASADHLHIGRLTFARRPLIVGVVHGLAGSGSLTAIALASLPSLSSQLVYITLFGVGSMGGMALLSGLAGWPLAKLGRQPLALAVVSAIAGLASMTLGVVWGTPLIERLTLSAY